MLNTPVVAVIAGVSLNLVGGARLMPTFVHNAIHMLGQSVIPLSLILTGATAADWIFRLKANHFAWPATGSCLIRLVALPMI